MLQSRILLDSNAYFRLAQSIRPLLNTPFGEKNYCLYVIKELQSEYAKSTRLKLKFPWVNEPEYADNRTNKLSLTKKEKDDIQRGYDFILDCEYIDLSKIRAIADYLNYQNDTPKDFRKDFKKMFGEEAPR